MLLRAFINGEDIFLKVRVGDRDPHPLSSQDIGGAEQDRITELGSGMLCLLHRADAPPLRAPDPVFLENLIEELAVLGPVYILRRGPEYGDSHLPQGARQRNRGLPAELDDRGVRLLQLYDVSEILGAERFKVESVRDIEIRGDGFRIIVYDDGLPALPGEREAAVDRAIVELNPLPDPYGTGAEDQDPFLLRPVPALPSRFIL